MTQIPIYNVNNNCSTGSTGLHMARQMVIHGAADCVMVVGFEKMSAGSLKSMYKDREDPTGTSGKMMKMTRGVTNAPGAAQLFGNAGREYMEKYILPSYPNPRGQESTQANNQRSIDTAPTKTTSPKSPASTTSTPPRTPTPNSATSTPSIRSSPHHPSTPPSQNSNAAPPPTAAPPPSSSRKTSSPPAPTSAPKPSS